MGYNAYGWLTTCPAGDCNYKSALENATIDELKRAIDFLRDKPGNKSRISACERELRRRARNNILNGEHNG